jgi:hypothetical protein
VKSARTAPGKFSETHDGGSVVVHLAPESSCLRAKARRSLSFG